MRKWCCSFRAQEVFKEALHTESLELCVIKSEAPPLPKLPPPSLHRPGSGGGGVPKTDAKLLHHPLAQSSPVKPDPSRGGESAPKPGAFITTPPARPQMNGQSNLTSTPDSSKSPSSATTSEGEIKPPVSPTKKTPPAVPARNPNTVLTSQPKSRIVAPTNTRRIGKKIHIQLKKGIVYYSLLLLVLLDYHYLLP